MDGDDISHPRRIERQLSLLDRHPDIAVAGCLVAHFPRDRLLGGMARYEKWLNGLVTAEQIARNLFVESPLCHPSVVMRREAYDRVEGYQDNGMPEDYGLWLQLAEAGFSFAKVDEVLFYWRDGGARLSRTDPRYLPKRFLDLKLAFLSRRYLVNCKRIAIWGAGKLGRQLSRALGALDFEVTTFIDVDPRKVGHQVHGAPVIASDGIQDAGTDIILVSVGNGQARERIRSYLVGGGLSELRDFVCVA